MLFDRSFFPQSHFSIFILLSLFLSLLLIPLFFHIRKRAKKRHPQKKPSLKPPGLGLRAFSIRELSRYNGTNDQPCYISVLSQVFKVDPNLYGPEGPYHMFAGKDVTIPLAKMELSTEKANIPDPETQLSPDEVAVARQWLDNFHTKYSLVGWVDYSLPGT